jgi:acyl-CoA hydrolase
MEWVTQVGTMAAARVARSTVAVGSMDDIDFLHPVLVGEIAILRAQVEYVGTSSLEVGVRVYTENLSAGERAVTLNSHLVFVSVDSVGKPRPIGDKISPRDAGERTLVEAARARRQRRLSRFARRAERVLDTGDESVDLRWRFESARAVLPEDALFGTMMFAGKLLKDIDEAGGILSMRYCRGLVMTACLDSLDFYAPIATHEVVTFRAGLNHVGTSSLEVGVKVLAEIPWTGEIRHACTAYLTFVHLGQDRRPRPCLPFSPQTPGERRRWEAAVIRREARLARVRGLKASLLETVGT